MSLHRTLSSALLEPVNSESFEQTLTYVKARVMSDADDFSSGMYAIILAP